MADTLPPCPREDCTATGHHYHAWGRAWSHVEGGSGSCDAIARRISRCYGPRVTVTTPPDWGKTPPDLRRLRALTEAQRDIPSEVVAVLLDRLQAAEVACRGYRERAERAEAARDARGCPESDAGGTRVPESDPAPERAAGGIVTTAHYGWCIFDTHAKAIAYADRRARGAGPMSVSWHYDPPTDDQPARLDLWVRFSLDGDPDATLTGEVATAVCQDLSEAWEALHPYPSEPEPEPAGPTNDDLQEWARKLRLLSDEIRDARTE